MIFTIFVDTEKKLMELIESFVSTPVSVFTGGVAILVESFIMVWALYRAYLILAGLVSEPIMTILKELLIKTAIISVVIVNGVYMTTVNNTLKDTGRNIASDILQEEFSVFSKLDKGFSNIAAAFEAIQNKKKDKQNNVDLIKQHGEEGFLKYMAIGMAYVDDAFTNGSDAVDVTNNLIEPIINFLKLVIVAIGFFVLSISAFITVMMNQIFFKLCLGVGPLFVFFAAFEKTRGWFSSWLNMTLGYCFSYPMIAITAASLMQIFDSLIMPSNKEPEYISWGSVFTVLVLCYVFSIIIQRVGDIASGFFSAGNIADGTALALAAASGKVSGKMMKEANSATRKIGSGFYKAWENHKKSKNQSSVEEGKK